MLNTGQLLSGHAIDMRLNLTRAIYLKSFSFICDIIVSIPFAAFIIIIEVISL
jgi:hypothetical protein